MSPFGATSRLFGWKKYSGSRPPPGLPSVRSSLPSGLNLKTWWPLVGSAAGGGGAPAAPPRPRPPPIVQAQSTTQTLSSLSTKIPCGERIIPVPNDFTSLPVASNFSTGSSVEPKQLFTPQRSATHTLLPSRSIATALVEPQVRPSGIFAHPSTVVYGLGRSL